MPIDRFSRLVLGTNLAGTDNGDGSLTIDASGGGGSGGHTIADEGAALAARATLDFTGAGVTVTDDAAGNKTKVTIPGANPAADVPAGGTAGQVLTKDTATDYDTSWQPVPGGIAIATYVGLGAIGGGISVPNGTTTPVPFTTEAYDTHGFHAPASTQIVIPAGLAGYYMFNYWWKWGAGTTGQRIAELYINSIVSITDRRAVAGETDAILTYMPRLAAGDIVELRVWHNEGTAINLNSAGVQMILLRLL